MARRDAPQLCLTWVACGTAAAPFPSGPLLEGAGGFRGCSSATGCAPSLCRSTHCLLCVVPLLARNGRILKGISGVACPGEVVALLGPSGAGKTTLLAALAGRTRISGGAVTVDGIAKHKGEGAATAAERRKMPKQSVAFVTQEDTLLTQLTVFETLWYASAVRLPAHYSQEVRERNWACQRMLAVRIARSAVPGCAAALLLLCASQERLARVHDVIKRLGLAKVAHTQVGTVMSRGLSGGERKRLNVAQELLTDPPVLLADGERMRT